MYPHPAFPASGSFVAEQVEALRALGHQVDVLHFKGYRTRFNYAVAAIRTYIKSRTQDYDIVHAHYGLTGLVAAFSRPSTLFLTLHGSDILRSPAQRWLSYIACGLSDQVIAVSRGIQEKVESILLPCGINCETFRPLAREYCRSVLHLKSDLQYVLFPFNPNRVVKQFPLANDAVRHARATQPKLRLLIVHDKPSHLMPLYYNASDVVLITSSSEGSPTTAKEALACNVPLVTTDVGDIREFFISLPSVSICEPTAESLGESLLKATSTPQVAEPQDIDLTFSSRVIAEELTELYHATLRRDTPTSRRRTF